MTGGQGRGVGAARGGGRGGGSGGRSYDRWMVHVAAEAGGA